MHGPGRASGRRAFFRGQIFQAFRASGFSGFSGYSGFLGFLGPEDGVDISYQIKFFILPFIALHGRGELMPLLVVKYLER